MNIAILGAGAMGLLYGAYLSQHNTVYLLCRNQEKVDMIQNQGVSVTEKDNSTTVYHPQAVIDSHSLPPLDVVILFVKAGQSKEALDAHRHLFQGNTTLLTLQNGSGHEALLSDYVSPEQLAIGISQEGSLLLSPCAVRHTGNGTTYFGKPQGDTETLADLEASCIACGFHAIKSPEILFFIWEKLIINASSSVMSGVLQKEQGYCYTCPSAWGFVQKLVAEMVEIANALGLNFDYDTQIQRMKTHLTTNPEGVPSICVDLRQGNPTEVDTISGSVIRAGKAVGLPTPTHTMIVDLVHAMEGR